MHFFIRFLVSEKSEIKLRRLYIRIDWKLLLPCILLGTSPALMQGTQPVLSYNLGAGLIGRVRKTFHYLLVSCVVGSCIIGAVCMIFPENIIGIFTNSTSLIEYSVALLRTYLCLLWIYGIQAACQYSFVALAQVKAAIFLTIWRKIILLISLIFFCLRMNNSIKYSLNRKLKNLGYCIIIIRIRK